MKAQTSTCCGVIWTRVLLGVLAPVGLAAVWAAMVPAAPREERSPLDAPAAEAAAKPDGKELFAREWIPNDPRSPRGDGLGPVFNDTSCVACHNQGGAGGGGPASKNVHTAANFPQIQQEVPKREPPTEPTAPPTQPTTTQPTTTQPTTTQPRPTPPTTTPQLATQPPAQRAGAPTAAPRTTTAPQDAGPQQATRQETRPQQATPQQAVVQRTRVLQQTADTMTRFTLTPTQSFVLHHFGTDAEFATWRATMAQSAAAVQMGGISGRMPSVGFVPSVGPPATSAPPIAGGGSSSGGRGRVASGDVVSGEVVIAQQEQLLLTRLVSLNSISQRNATALFGAGRIDAIPERVLEAVAAMKHAEFPKVSGRVARDDKGRVGRFGWKAQKASLDDFVLTACAVELGLHVPGHDQPPLPHKPDYKAPGLDLTKDECDALVKYIGELPAPVALKTEYPKHADFIASGKALFATVGCATCHTPKLGDVEGIYSDLLLHDMGPGLTDAGSSYGIFQPNPPHSTPSPEKPREIVKTPPVKTPAPVVATAQEWRTPPLWGVRDSGPYLHDGRATTLEQAVAFHGGQAEESTKKFNALSLPEKQKLLAFLKSLVAPEQLAAR